MQRLYVDKMQRPRRTSEFQEEPGTAAKRQSRVHRKGTSSTEQTPTYAGTTQKYSTRLRVSGSATRARSFLPTPQKTPLQSARALFTAEKQRSTMGLALHNDKKWIQDQTQRITEYLKEVWNPSGMTGISSDFFSRSNCLKQMSIKQFVAIINYFLHMIWGNRFAVGSNHVEDIVNILQKLNYPHQVNKSWLKTPNTTHSFGNVIVLFDFLMDFVLPKEFEFPLSELQANTTPNDELEPDLEFKAALLRTCENSFNLWDKNLEDAFQNMKQQQTDMLVQKRCGVSGLDALNKELNRLYAYHDSLKSQRPQIASEKERECERLKKFVMNAQIELEQFCECCKNYDLQLEQLFLKKSNCSMEFTRLKENIETMKRKIPEQLCNVKQRDGCIEKLKVLRLELQCHDRTVDELRNRDYRQQVQLSVIKMNATQEIENLNTILRDITFTLDITQPELRLEVSLNAMSENVQNLMPDLNALQKEIITRLTKSKEALNRTENEIEKLNYEVHIAKEPRIKAQESTKMVFINRQEQLETQIIKDFEAMFLSLQKLDLELSQLEMDLEYHQEQIINKRNAINQIEKECEELMSKGEAEHSAVAETREKYLNEHELNLDACIIQLKQLEEIVMRDKENDLSLLKTIE